MKKDFSIASQIHSVKKCPATYILAVNDTINVIKNAEGNNLPLYQMVCLAYSHKKMSQYLHDELG